MRVESLETRQMLAVTLNPLNNIQEPGGKDVLVPLTGVDSGGQPISYTFSSSNSAVTLSLVSTSSKSLKLDVSGTDKNGAAFSGTLIFKLFEDLAPANAARIEALVGANFYDGTTLGRVIDGFISQAGFDSAGTPLSTNQPVDDEFVSNLTFTSPGLLAMANAGSDTNDSEFFITAINSAGTSTPIPLSSMPQVLNYRYTIFGQLVGGFDTFQKIMQTNVAFSSRFNETSQPTNPITINDATLITDTQNAVLRVHAPANAAGGSSTITVTATGGGGATAQQTFTDSVITDTKTDPPFLGPVASSLITTSGQPLTFTLTSTDVDNAGVFYKVADANTFGTPAGVSVSINQANGQVTLTPDANFTGTVNLVAGVRASSASDTSASYDKQEFSLTVSAASTSITIANQNATVGSTVTVPITISNPHPAGTSGLATANLGLTYDPAVFDVSTSDIQLGSLTSSGWTMTPVVNSSTGQISIALTANSGQQLTGTSAGSLATVTFHVKSNAALGASPIKVVSSVQPNGTTFNTSLLDSGNHTVGLNPLPTNASNDPVFGNITVQSAQSVPSGGSNATVALTTAFNLKGITADGVKFSGGMDGEGYALSSTRLGSTVTWNGASFNLGAAGANNVVTATGQTITLPAGQFSKLAFLALSVDGNQKNQKFIVTYTDNTTATLTQSISDWHDGAGFTGESVAIGSQKRNKENGKVGKNDFDVFGYSITLDPTKTVASITLPNNDNIKVLAMTEIAPIAAPTSLTASSAVSGQVNLSWTAPTGAVTGYNVYRGTTAGGESTTALNSSPLAASATSYQDTTAIAGNKYFYVVQAINGPATSANSNEAFVTVSNSATSTKVDLSSAFNQVGITANGAKFSGGLDGVGHALSSNRLGPTVTSNSVTFNIGAAGANNVVSAKGQTISLPPGQFSKLSLLATSVYGNQAGQTFTVHYSDNTTTTFTQSFSDWLKPKGNTGETIALTTSTWNSNDGGSSHKASVYQYNITLDNTKTVASITLPNNSNVKLLAVTAVV